MKAMTTLFTPQLLRFLTIDGFRYCLSRTTELNNGPNEILITLTPVRTEPDIHNLPAAYDTYFEIDEEPVQLANGVDDVIVMIRLDSQTLLGYFRFVFGPRKLWRVA
jgi:hypothetical protein